MPLPAKATTQPAASHGRLLRASAAVNTVHEPPSEQSSRSVSTAASQKAGKGEPTSPSSIGKKRKRRPALLTHTCTNQRTNSGASSQSGNPRHREAPVSGVSTSSSFYSHSDSDLSSGSSSSPSTSHSSHSLHYDLDDMDLNGCSPPSSPVVLRKSASRKASQAMRKSSSAHSRNSRGHSSAAERDAQEQRGGAADEEGEQHDNHLLRVAPASELERLRKASILKLAEQAELPSATNLTKAQLIGSIVAWRSSQQKSDTSSSHSAQEQSRSLRQTSLSRFFKPTTPPDFSDDEDGHDAEGEETEAEPARRGLTPRKRKALRTRKSFTTLRVNAKPYQSPFKVRPADRSTAFGAKGSEGDESGSVVPTLRKQKSIHFASPARGRGRSHLPTKKLPAQKSNTSPLKPGSRTAKGRRALRERPQATDKPDQTEGDRMDEDWVDDAPPQPAVTAKSHPRQRRHRSAKASAQGNLRELSDAEMETTGPIHAPAFEGRTTRSASAKSSSVEAVTAYEGRSQSEDSPANTQGEEGDAEETDAEVDDTDADATQTDVRKGRAEEEAEDTYVDSDSTNVPSAASGAAETSSPSPLKVRRLRNGKLRVVPSAPPAGDVNDTDIEVEKQLTSQPPALISSRRGKRSNTIRKRSISGEQSKLPTPPLSTDNEEAKSADAEHVDELNGLDLESLNLVDKEISSKQLSKTSKIGSGGFKDVFVGIWRVGKRRNKVAIADIREKLTEMDIKELSLLRHLKHENIVRFIGVSIPDDTAKTGIPCMIVSELCSNGDLWDYLRGVKPPSNLEIFRMLLETARGLEYLHMHSIVHRDVKSSNVLVTRDRSCKINDFGLARVKRSQRSKMHSVVGTVNWQAVELWCAEPQYNEKVDVWSAAMTFWETMQWHEEYKSYPFEGSNEFKIYEEVGKKGMRPPTERIAELFGDGIVKLLNRMWEADPRKRPTMSNVCSDLERLIETTRIEQGI
ncbi:unnamed protein product [Jaminaea pallidilutea]